VLAAAIELADADGIEALSMRRLGRALGVEAMSLYNHVTDKDDVLDGMVDLVIGEIEVPPPGPDWKGAMRARATSARQVLRRHPWASTLIESRTDPGPARLRHHDAMLGALRGSGFSVAMATHAFALLDSYIYGFVLQESSLPFQSHDELVELTSAIVSQIPMDDHPWLAEVATELVLTAGWDFSSEFDFGLELILDGLERARDAS
jgi:AcrR family transcriptional regulator